MQQIELNSFRCLLLYKKEISLLGTFLCNSAFYVITFLLGYDLILGQVTIPFRRWVLIQNNVKGKIRSQTLLRYVTVRNFDGWENGKLTEQPKHYIWIGGLA